MTHSPQSTVNNDSSATGIDITTNREEPVIFLNRGSWERECKPGKADISHHYHARGDDRIHSHLPPGADGSPITWKSLLALGISGGLLPCPSALVMLLSVSALDNVGWGMMLVVAFSLGLAERAECDRINLSLCQTEF